MENICNSPITGSCSFSNLTYAQWLSGSVLLYPLGDMDFDLTSYQIFYNDYTILDYPPEAFYYSARSGNQFLTQATVYDLYQDFNITGLFNSKIDEDIWLQSFVPGAYYPISDPSTMTWLRYLALNFGLGGWFMPITPRQLIEGY